LRQSNELLMKEIQVKRETMIRIAEREGISSAETIRCSQELDKLILEFQQSMKKGNRYKEAVKGPYKEMILWPRELAKV
jgi:stage 0 sporulation regulatory protein